MSLVALAAEVFLVENFVAGLAEDQAAELVVFEAEGEQGFALRPRHQRIGEMNVGFRLVESVEGVGEVDTALGELDDGHL